MIDKAMVSLLDLNLNPPLALALGDMIIAWAAAENAIQAVYQQITKMDWQMVTDLYYRLPNFESRMKIVQALVRSHHAPPFDAAAVLATLNQLWTLASTRNNWIHARWAASIDMRRTYVLDMRATPPKRRKPITANSVRQHVQAVRRVTEELHKLMP